jgi:hypothetical protein
MVSLDHAIAILEQMIAMLQASQEKTEANIETSQEPRESESKTDLEETEATDLEANPEEIKFVVVSKEGAAVKTVRALKKQYGDRHLAVGYRLQLKKRTQGSGWFQKKLAAAQGRLTRHA